MRKRNIKGQRDGAVMVEFAIVVPVLFLLFFASMELCRVAMIRHTVNNAIYEGCRVGIIPGATTGEVQGETQRILSSIGLNNVSISIAPPVIDRSTEEITVRVDVPLDDNSFVPNQFVAGRSVIGQLTLRREGTR